MPSSPKKTTFKDSVTRIQEKASLEALDSVNEKKPKLTDEEKLAKRQRALLRKERKRQQIEAAKVASETGESAMSDSSVVENGTRSKKERKSSNTMVDVSIKNRESSVASPSTEPRRSSKTHRHKEEELPILFEHIGKDPSAFKDSVIQFHVMRTDSLVSHALLKHPVCQIHIYGSFEFNYRYKYW